MTPFMFTSFKAIEIKLEEVFIAYDLNNKKKLWIAIFYGNPELCALLGIQPYKTILLEDQTFPNKKLIHQIENTILVHYKKDPKIVKDETMLWWRMDSRDTPLLYTEHLYLTIEKQTVENVVSNIRRLAKKLGLTIQEESYPNIPRTLNFFLKPTQS